MGQTYCRVGGVDALSAVTGRTHNINTAVVHVDLNVYFLCLRHNCYGCGGGVDTSTGLGLRDTLYAVYAGLVLHLGVSALTGDHGLNLFEAADAVLTQGNNLYLPVLALCVVYVHTVKLCRKQGCLVAACAGTNLQDDVLVIVRVLRQ